VRAFVRACVRACEVTTRQCSVVFPQISDDLFTLQNMEAELEMCFVRKVKTYCETKKAQQDAIVSDAQQVYQPLPEKPSILNVLTAHLRYIIC